jgi:hypothetical protein
LTVPAEELNRLSNEVLSAFEIQEARLLNWGFINGTLTLGDLDARLPDMLARLQDDSAELAAIWKRAQQAGISGKQILENLEHRKLIFPGSSQRYRTRFAETVRALFLLRQRFSHDDWQTGERLVGDLRLILQRRRYPKREIAVEELFTQLTPLNLPPSQVAVINALLQEHGSELNLARFQAQSILRILRNLQAGTDSAVVIGAGTGAGKTKAFYIPALTAIADELSGTDWVQALAIYPRKELLKDQLRETFAEARKLDGLLRQQGKRPIRVGAYFGDVPSAAADVLQGRRENWRRTRDRTGWICPYVACPHCGEQTMVWPQQDLERENENNRRNLHGRYARLTCESCHATVDNTTLLLTRQQMVQSPPDILFTTTEMLNRRLANAGERHLFGIGAVRPPRLILMDEIHLNEGIHGAQVAYLLRRWRHLRGQQARQGVCIVGLSATLTQADHFFARLTGTPIARVSYISPADADLVKEGIEYNVMLKGDPVSGTTLLSTSVRSAMLLCRILDPLQAGARVSVSSGAYGQRAFAFSDKLDVINRWYHIEKEVENPTEPYSSYLWVEQHAQDGKQRYDQGQNWYFVPLIHGGPTVLTSGLRLDITSSQYGGVDNRANLVIASSTLEVGYNDPTVGAILQHKTPFSRAAFIQRKGRAGRTRTMRPWTVLIASAYGHDRWAFQHAETLFDPLLPPLDLPLENYYVQKIQSTFALLDWLASQLAPIDPKTNIWQLLSSHESARDPSLDAPRRRLAAILLGLLEDEATRTSLKEYLMAALELGERAGYIADTLLWGEPRPLLLEVIPTALRQLETNWQRTTHGDDAAWQFIAWDDNIANRPLPDYVPAALFSDLKSPDILIRIPEHRVEAGKKPAIRDEESLSLSLALSEYVPGKVNKRFARKDKIRESHWFEIPEQSYETKTIDLAQLAAHYDPTPTRVSLDGNEVKVFCPRTVTLTTVPAYIRPTSSAHFLWRSRFLPQSRQSNGAAGLPITIRPSSPMHNLITQVAVHTQVNGSWVSVTRAAPEVRVFTRFDSGGERRSRARFVADGQTAALGFAVDVDALGFAFAPLAPLRVRAHPRWPLVYRHLAARFFYHQLTTDPLVENPQLSDLEIEWLWQVSLTMIVQTAIEHQVTLSAAMTIATRDFLASARKTLAVIFGTATLDSGASTMPLDASDNEEHQAEPVGREVDAPSETEEIGYLHAKLLRMLGDPQIQQLLIRHWPVLWSDDHPQLDAWLSSVHAFSLGAVLFAALLEMTPEIQSDDLHLDLDEGQRTIWISEATAGGVGLVAKIADSIAQQPRQFDLHFLKAIHSCSRAGLAEKMNSVAALVQQNDAELMVAFEAIRKSRDLPRIEETRRDLTNLLDHHGIATTRALSVSINTKFLRPNSGPDTDALVAALVDFWQREEERIGCAIDLRAIAAAATFDPIVQTLVQRILSRVGNQDGNTVGAQVYNLLQSLLWLDCHDGCPDCIDRPQRYQPGPKPSRALLSLLLSEEQALVDAGLPDWEETVRQQLAATAQAEIACEHSELNTTVTAIAAFLATPLDVESQLLFPSIERIERRSQRWIVYLVLSEFAGE